MEPVKFKIRASACSEIMAGTIGLTDVQQAKYNELFSRRADPMAKALTANMEKELAELQYKLDNPELPTGAKTYCRQWLKEYLYKRREEIRSKYIDKGNKTEEDGFTLMAVQLRLGMVFKNYQYRENEYMCGTWDLLTGDTVYDNKSCWSLDTFPMFDTTNPKKEYEWQLQVYSELAGVENTCVAYTLNDISEDMLIQQIRWINDHTQRAKTAINMIYTREYWEVMRSKHFNDAEHIEFVEIPGERRVKPFYFKRDSMAIYRIIERVKMCNLYINSILNS